MDKRLREDCLRLFEAGLAQMRSGLPGPSFLTSREFQKTIALLCDRLRAESEPDSGPDMAPLDEPNNVMHLIVSADRASAQTGFTHLRKWLSGAAEVAICDPYLFHFRPSIMFNDVDAYARALAGIFPKSVKRLDVYANGYTKVVRATVFRALKEGRTVRHFNSSGLHDRFVIKDREEAKILGTSFGGFGSKFFALLDLSPSDVAEVRQNLQTLCPFSLHRNRHV